MKITEYAIQNKTVSFVLTILLIAGGILSYTNLGRLEFPVFTIKTAIVITAYPGATPTEVEQEVTDPIETAVQQLSQIKEVRSISRAGLSIIFVDIKDSFMNTDIPQVWDELRRKVSDVQPQLPAGVFPSEVNDDWGDEYGIFFALTGEGYDYKELKDYADMLKRELLLVKDVASVDIWGEQQEVVYMEISRSRMAELGISPSEITDTLNRQNMVADSGKALVGSEYLRIHPTGHFASVEDMGELLVRSDNAGNLIYLKDIVTITRGYADPPQWLMQYNGHPALGLGISTVSDGNVATMGKAVRERIRELETNQPVGMELGIIAYQSDTVSESVDGFVVNLIEAVLIVIGVLCVFMGFSSGIMIGAVLLLNIFGTFILMDAMGISLQLISLGALILALGMLVDNAIVVTEGILVRVRKGADQYEAATETVSQTMWPLLGATVVAILAFAAIGVSQDSTGEFCGSLFKVLAISLSLSWILAITLTPLFCILFLRVGDKQKTDDPYKGGFFQKYRGLLNTCLCWRWVTVGFLMVLLTCSVFGFGFVEESFFPSSRRPQFMIDYWRPEGTHIQKTSEDLKKIGAYLGKFEQVESVTTFAGQGALRFLLTYEPEMPNSAYGQLLVTVRDFRKIDSLLPEIREYLALSFPDAETKIKKFTIGPGTGAKIEARFRGPDEVVLRQLSEQAQAVMAKDPVATNIRDDWRQKVKVVQPRFAEAKARRIGISRPLITDALEVSFSGKRVGVYREDDKQIPIILRLPEKERNSADNMNNVQVFSPATSRSVPLRQIISGVRTRWEDPIIRRKNRERTITAQCDPKFGNASVLFERLRPQTEAIELPAGYEIDWGGEYEDSADAQKSLFRLLPLFFVAMTVTVIMLFNAIRQPLIIFLCLPLAVIGVTAGLLVTNQPFGFMSLLGFLSLSGMLVKNAVVLIDQIDLEISLGKNAFYAILDSSVSRMRPVLMAAVTTVLGMIPLVFDPFYAGMSITIMAGLAFGTVLTLVVVPVLYAIFFRVREDVPVSLEQDPVFTGNEPWGDASVLPAGTLQSALP